jgi:hypothetical protein
MMTDKPKKLSDTARALLTAAAMRNDHLVPFPKLPVAAARQVVRSLLNAGFAEDVPVPINHPGCGWRTGMDGGVLALRATALGIARVTEADGDPATFAPIRSVVERQTDKIAVLAVGSALIATVSTADPLAIASAHIERAKEGQDDPDRGVTAQGPVLSAEAPEAASKPAARPAKRADGLRRAAQALLDAWDKSGDRGQADADEIIGPITELRAALATSVDGSACADPLRTRPDTKQAQVLNMLARNEGASGPAIAEAMGWAPHTVRGFLAGLAKKGIDVEVLERVRQRGPNKQGARGSYSVYRRAAEAG